MSIKSLKLYHYPLTCSVRVKWMLHEVLGTDFETETVAVIKGAMMTPDMLAKNPNHNLQMMQFGASWMDSMLWQIRLHRDLLPDGFKQKSVLWMHKKKWASEIEPQLIARLSRHDFICRDTFNAAECISGYIVFWANSYGLCSDPIFKAYLAKLGDLLAFQQAFADADQLGK